MMADVEVMHITCVQCPMGCPLEVTLEDGVVTSVTGNTCPRGRTYGEHEATHPERVVTSLVTVEGDWHPISVKTATPVPKESVPAVLAQIRAACVRPPVAEGDVIVANAAGTGVDVVATKGRS
ncbi:MAG: DUF1667 domain-containing protein [Atopobiaceae bacterium]|nr:DUF1667 domain-containing protein [Atopobiaceae bacterium]MBQ6651247.1 DUF1667 domain-containing protein [Atopobiaceae bacterium]